MAVNRLSLLDHRAGEGAYPLLHVLLGLLAQLVVLVYGTTQGRHDVGSIVQQFAYCAERVGDLVYGILSSLGRDSLDAADAGGDARL